MSDKMTSNKVSGELLPCPLCGGDAKELSLLHHYRCSNNGCPLVGARLPLDAWQSLPRVSGELAEIEREMDKQCASVGCSTGEYERINGWRIKLRSIATHAEKPGEPSGDCMAEQEVSAFRAMIRHRDRVIASLSNDVAALQSKPPSPIAAVVEELKDEYQCARERHSKLVEVTIGTLASWIAQLRESAPEPVTKAAPDHGEEYRCDTCGEMYCHTGHQYCKGEPPSPSAVPARGQGEVWVLRWTREDRGIIHHCDVFESSEDARVRYEQLKTGNAEGLRGPVTVQFPPTYVRVHGAPQTAPQPSQDASYWLVKRPNGRLSVRSSEETAREIADPYCTVEPLYSVPPPPSAGPVRGQEDAPLVSQADFDEAVREGEEAWHRFKPGSMPRGAHQCQGQQGGICDDYDAYRECVLSPVTHGPCEKYMEHEAKQSASYWLVKRPNGRLSVRSSEETAREIADPYCTVEPLYAAPPPSSAGPVRGQVWVGPFANISRVYASEAEYWDCIDEGCRNNGLWKPQSVPVHGAPQTEQGCEKCKGLDSVVAEYIDARDDALAERDKYLNALFEARTNAAKAGNAKTLEIRALKAKHDDALIKFNDELMVYRCEWYEWREKAEQAEHNAFARWDGKESERNEAGPKQIEFLRQRIAELELALDNQPDKDRALDIFSWLRSLDLRGSRGEVDKLTLDEARMLLGGRRYDSGRWPAQPTPDSPAETDDPCIPCQAHVATASGPKPCGDHAGCGKWQDYRPAETDEGPCGECEVGTYPGKFVSCIHGRRNGALCPHCMGLNEQLPPHPKPNKA